MNNFLTEFEKANNPYDLSIKDPASKEKFNLSTNDDDGIVAWQSI